MIIINLARWRIKMEDYQKKYQQWLNNHYFDEDFRKELGCIANDLEEIKDRFYTNIRFGTAGMRGLTGAGSNRMNRYVIRKVSQGFSNFLRRRNTEVLHDARHLAIAIAYDCRHMSKAFAQETAAVMAANGFKVFIYDDVRTTPQLSYTVRALHLMGGVMVTASHNPPEYSGYKVYDENGCQLVPALADQLVKEVEDIEEFDQVKYESYEMLLKKGMISIVDPQIDDQFIDMVANISIRPELLKESKLKAVYTPLHGVGGPSVIRMVEKVGFQGLIPVEEQMVPDGDFPTIKTPNPETEVAFEYAKRTMIVHQADIAIANDPDCDRVGVVDSRGHLISGNQLGALFTEYILSSKPSWDPEDYLVNTVVSSDMANAIAAHYGVRSYRTLTGFKFIGEIVQRNPSHFILGFEESYGYFFDPHVRDKDGVQAALMAIEMSTFFGADLTAKMESLYQKYGYYLDETIQVYYEGAAGKEKMASIMESFRHPSFAFSSSVDYLHDDTGLAKSNVLKFYFDDCSWMVIRPSGTEPKLKIYFSAYGNTRKQAQDKIDSYKELVKTIC